MRSEKEITEMRDSLRYLSDHLFSNVDQEIDVLNWVLGEDACSCVVCDCDSIASTRKIPEGVL